MSRTKLKIFELGTIFLFFITQGIQYTVANFPNIDQWATTKVNVRKITYAWTITNFNYTLQDNDMIFTSPIFSDNYDNEIKWQLKLARKSTKSRISSRISSDYEYRYNSYYTRSTTPSTVDDNRDIGLYLTIMSGTSNGGINMRLGVLNSINELTFIKEKYVKSFHPGIDIDFEISMPRSVLSDYSEIYLPDNKLTIVGEIAMNIRFTNTSFSCTSSKSDKSNYVHSDKFELLLEDETFSDVNINIGIRQFKAHRVILASISSVFLEIFKNNQDNEKMIIEIQNIDPEVFQEFLRFSYTGKVEKIEKIAKDLLAVAQEYKVTELQTMCEEALCQSLSYDNALDYFQLAVRTNSIDLKRQALKYITVHAESLIETPRFLTMISEPSSLISVLHTFVNNSTN